MLVLQAAYMNPILQPLLLQHITTDDLRVLYDHTIRFLELIASPSSALTLDWKILKYTGRLSGLWSHSDVTSSFGSSGDTPLAGH
jgi:hypothetical protein